MTYVDSRFSTFQKTATRFQTSTVQPLALVIKKSGTKTASVAFFILSDSWMYRSVVVKDLCRIFFCNTGAGMRSAFSVA